MKRISTTDALRAFLDMSTGSWPAMKRAAESLTNADLQEAEEMEKLGQRRSNLLRVIFTERKRAGERGRMLCLNVESNYEPRRNAQSSR